MVVVCMVPLMPVIIILDSRIFHFSWERSG